MPHIIRIAITGGPCAGKTSALRDIRAHVTGRGYKVITGGEAATEFITNGIEPWECASQEEYQRCQMGVQLCASGCTCGPRAAWPTRRS